MRQSSALLVLLVQTYMEEAFWITQDSGVDGNPEFSTELPKKRRLYLIHNFWNLTFNLKWPGRDRRRSHTHRLRHFFAQFSESGETMHHASIRIEGSENARTESRNACGGIKRSLDGEATTSPSSDVAVSMGVIDSTG
jgi:hypothetical protein